MGTNYYFGDFRIPELFVSNPTNITFKYEVKHLSIKAVHFSGPVTVVIWDDGTKTMVRCNAENFDHEKGLAMAIAKKFLGTNKSGSNYYDIFKKWLPEDEKEEM